MSLPKIVAVSFAAGSLLVVCASPATFQGRVAYPNGRPVVGVKVTARDDITGWNTPPWQWGPGWKIRGHGITDSQGRYSFRSSTKSPAELWAEDFKRHIWEVVPDPDPSDFEQITIGDTKIDVPQPNSELQ